VAGIIFNGKSNPESERIILRHSGYKTIWHVKDEPEINSETIASYAEKIKQKIA
jgi:dethiobiotin synthetase